MRQLQESQRYGSVLELAHAEIQERCAAIEAKQQQVAQQERQANEDKLSPQRYRHHDTSTVDSLLLRPPSYVRSNDGNSILSRSTSKRAPPPPPA